MQRRPPAVGHRAGLRWPAQDCSWAMCPSMGTDTGAEDTASVLARPTPATGLGGSSRHPRPPGSRWASFRAIRQLEACSEAESLQQCSALSPRHGAQRTEASSGTMRTPSFLNQTSSLLMPEEAGRRRGDGLLLLRPASTVDLATPPGPGHRALHIPVQPRPSCFSLTLQMLPSCCLWCQKPRTALCAVPGTAGRL